MFFKLGLLLVTLLVGSLATPTLEEKGLSRYFVSDDVSDASRIMGGVQLANGARPHMVALTDGFLIKNFVCGGSIIGTRTVLTAAHCIASVYSYFTGLSNLLRVKVGTNRWNSGGSEYRVSRNITYPHWGWDKHDLGLLITSSNIRNTNLVQPIAIDFSFVPGGVPVTVAGWGRTRITGSASATLMELATSTLEGKQCEDDILSVGTELGIDYIPYVDSRLELCTYHSFEHGTCNGDSGSALVTASGQQVGIVSWGFRCALGAPDVFVRLSYYEAFITSNTI